MQFCICFIYIYVITKYNPLICLNIERKTNFFLAKLRNATPMTVQTKREYFNFVQNKRLKFFIKTQIENNRVVSNQIEWRHFSGWKNPPVLLPSSFAKAWLFNHWDEIIENREADSNSHLNLNICFPPFLPLRGCVTKDIPPNSAGGRYLGINRPN